MDNPRTAEINKDPRMSLIVVMAIGSMLVVISVQIACLAIVHAHFKADDTEVGWFDAGCRRIAARLVSDKAERLPEIIGIGMITLSAVMLLFAALSAWIAAY